MKIHFRLKNTSVIQKKILEWVKVISGFENDFRNTSLRIFLLLSEMTIPKYIFIFENIFETLDAKYIFHSSQLIVSIGIFRIQKYLLEHPI